MIPIGEGVFETLKVVDSRPLAMTRHLDRLARSAGELGLEAPVLADVRAQAEAHLTQRPLPLGRLRLTWLATEDGATLAIDSAPASARAEAVELALSEWRIDESAPLSGLKTTAYVNYLAAAEKARSAGFDDALLATSSDLICEATTANIFYVLDGLLCTPPTSAGCLPGIARGLVLELCEVAEVAMPTSMLAEATEVFVTSSLREVQPVARVGTWTYPSPGPVTAEVMAAWRRFLDADGDPPPR